MMAASHESTPSEDSRPPGSLKSQRPMLWVFLAVLSVFFIWDAFPRAGAGQNAAKQARIDGWLKEVIQDRAPTTCAAVDARARAHVVTEGAERISVWGERARVDSSAYLLALDHVEQALACGEEDGALKVEMAALRQEGRRLIEKITQLLRSHHARLRRAENEGDRAEARAQVSALKILLLNHEGELLAYLMQRERILSS